LRLKRARCVLFAVGFLLGAVASGEQALAGTATHTLLTLAYVAAPGEANQLVIRGDPWEGFHVADATAPVTAGAGCASVSVNEVFCPGAALVPGNTLIRVVLGDMGDSVRVRGESDTIRVNGGAGADDLKGGSADNYLDGGPGPDVFRASPHFTSTDVVDYSRRTNPVKVTVGDGRANDGGPGEGDLITNGMTDVLGGKAGDTMSVTRALPQFGVGLRGRGGDDVLTLQGDGGLLLGGAGDDTLVNATREDGLYLIGGGGNDVLQGGVGKDRLTGRAGNDVLFGKRGSDNLVGGQGADLLVGGVRNDWMSGGEGPDLFRARDKGRDRVRGGPDRDRARIDRGLDRLREVEVIL
jgi:Ca2+-binding RTX toxin-like protein